MILLYLILFFCRASAVIYQLNETEFNRMPPVYHLDSYDECIRDKEGTYCLVDINLVSEDNSSLLNMIKEYSERKETHFNHSVLHHGLCVTKSCKDYVHIDYKNTTKDLKQTIERCMNDTIWNEYKLKTKIGEKIICNDRESEMVLGPADIAVAVIVLGLMLLNIAGSLYDFIIIKDDAIKGYKWLLSFSIRRNWRILTAPNTGAGDPSVQRLRGLSGMRTLTIATVILVHSLLPFVTSTDNVLVLEKLYSKIFYHVVLDGTVLVQTFFVISGCLLAYRLQIQSEKTTITWKMIPRGIMLRWLRLTPSYAIVLAIIATWFRFAGSGPLWHVRYYFTAVETLKVVIAVNIYLLDAKTLLCCALVCCSDPNRFYNWTNLKPRFIQNGDHTFWIFVPCWYCCIVLKLCVGIKDELDILSQAVVDSDVTDCRNYGWHNLIYINNLSDTASCVPPSWYLAADMQLFVIGIFILVLVKSNRARKVVLSVIFVMSVLAVPLHTYFQNLEAHLILSPEVTRGRFLNDHTFNHSYKRAHTNMSSYVIGLALGLLVYELQRKDIDIEKYKKYKYLFWATVPVGLTLIHCYAFLYADGAAPPLIAKAFFSGIYRTSFGLLTFVLILGMAFKIENVYRPILEWHGWRSPDKVSYSAYILHLLVIEMIVGSRTTLTSANLPEIILTCSGVTFTSFLFAFIFWLLIEAPLTHLVKLLVPAGGKKTEKPELDVDKMTMSERRLI